MWMKPSVTAARYASCSVQLKKNIPTCSVREHESRVSHVQTDEKGFNASHAAALPPPTGCGWMFPRGSSSPHLEGKWGGLYLPWCLKRFFKRVQKKTKPSQLTWTVAALQDDVINGSVTPHWWTSDGFKHDLEGQTRWEEAVGCIPNSKSTSCSGYLVHTHTLWNVW